MEYRWPGNTGDHTDMEVDHAVCVCVSLSLLLKSRPHLYWERRLELKYANFTKWAKHKTF